MTRVEHPSAGRVAGALLLASLAAAAPMVILGPFAIIAVPFAFVIALGHAVVLGLPLYLLVRSRTEIAWWHAALAGVAIGAGPVTLAGADYILGVRGSIIVSLAFGAFGFIGAMVFRAWAGPSAREEAFDASVFE
jgi:hypothetical protein